MPSQERDPFPMSSPQAKELSKSVPGEEGAIWSSMTLDENKATPDDRHSDRREARSSLVHPSSKHAPDANKEDIYADMEIEEDDEDEEDDFFDVPLEEMRGSFMNKMWYKGKRSLLKLYKRLYGEKLPPSEMIRTLCLAMTLFFMIGGYWLLRSLKDPVLTALCGVEAIPKAKMVSVFVVLGVVSFYNHLLDSDLPRHHLFYIFGMFYFLLFVTIACCLMTDSIGLGNKIPNPGRILGWISYCSIESFGSVMVSLFWSFANSNISLETAKASYGVMVATAQIGSILGPAFVNQYAESIGLAKCYLVGSLYMLLLQGTMYTYVSVYGTSEQRDKKSEAEGAPPKKKEKAGILEGLILFWEHNYVKGIFAISCLFMIEVTIVDFTMKVLAKEFFSGEHPCNASMSCYNPEDGSMGLTDEATNAFTAFMGLFGVATNSLSFLFSLLGTSAVIRYLGLRLTLLLFPSLCLMVIIGVRLHPTLASVFIAMIMLKACSYALNNPTKEILYQPTSSGVRYKAKSWIDIFGARGSKAVGSLVTNAFSNSAENLVANGSLVGMAVASFLIWNARFMGKKFDEYTATGYVVGEEGSDGGDGETVPNANVGMAIEQNETNDTSCAIDDADDKDNKDSGDGDDDEHAGKEFAKKSQPQVSMV